MKKKGLRALTMVLSLLLLVTLLPISAFALDCVQTIQYLGWSDETNSYSIKIHDSLNCIKKRIKIQVSTFV